MGYKHFQAKVLSIKTLLSMISSKKNGYIRPALDIDALFKDAHGLSINIIDDTFNISVRNSDGKTVAADCIAISHQCAHNVREVLREAEYLHIVGDAVYRKLDGVFNPLGEFILVDLKHSIHTCIRRTPADVHVVILSRYDNFIRLLVDEADSWIPNEIIPEILHAIDIHLLTGNYSFKIGNEFHLDSGEYPSEEFYFGHLALSDTFRISAPQNYSKHVLTVLHTMLSAVVK